MFEDVCLDKNFHDPQTGGYVQRKERHEYTAAESLSGARGRNGRAPEAMPVVLHRMWRSIREGFISSCSCRVFKRLNRQ
ncbi:hypothetical protein BDZ89DRAFT_770009 [Hymenopellis radicata]|nr:hypothetical protein BDZ89DRAFT_770009 [Hymenopellis radicata]